MDRLVRSIGPNYRRSTPGRWSHQTDIGASGPAKSASIEAGSDPIAALVEGKHDATSGKRFRTTDSASRPQLTAATTSSLHSMLNLSVPIPLTQALRFDRRERS
jgi:hypothetical protein